MTRPHSPRPPLTRRNVEVLRLAARGLSTDQIARRLFLTPHTVRTHFQRAARALGTSGSRTHAVAVALALGYLKAGDVLPAHTDGSGDANAPSGK